MAHYLVDSTLRHSLRKLCVTIKKNILTIEMEGSGRVRSDGDNWKKCSEAKGSLYSIQRGRTHLDRLLLLKSCHRFDRKDSNGSLIDKWTSQTKWIPIDWEILVKLHSQRWNGSMSFMLHIFWTKFTPIKCRAFVIKCLAVIFKLFDSIISINKEGILFRLIRGKNVNFINFEQNRLQ